MPFVFENISAADREKYNLTDSNPFYQTATTRWTVDRQGDMFLLPRTGQGPESIRGQRNWAFYWRGNMLDILIRSLGTHVDEITSHAWSHEKVLRIDQITEALEAKRSQIIDDLRSALIANRAFGLLNEYKTYDVILDVE